MVPRQVLHVRQKVGKAQVLIPELGGARVLAALHNG